MNNKIFKHINLKIKYKHINKFNLLIKFVKKL